MNFRGRLTQVPGVTIEGQISATDRRLMAHPDASLGNSMEKESLCRCFRLKATKSRHTWSGLQTKRDQAGYWRWSGPCSTTASKTGLALPLARTLMEFGPVRLPDI